MDLLELVKVVVLGIIEGITEWLPISSTGHLILADEFIKLKMSPQFIEMFTVVIQLGAIMAVVVIYWNKLFPFSFKKGPFIKTETMNLWFKIIFACLPAAVVGLKFDDYLNDRFYNYKTVALMLIFYGVLFIIVENLHKGKTPRIKSLKDLSYTTALMIGLFQVLALIPGTSRSGATIIGAIIIGTSRTVAAEFTFFLAIPVMFGASLLKVLKFGLVFTSWELVVLLVGMFVSFIVSILAIKFLVGYIKKNDFKFFGYYRIVLGIIVIAYFMFAR